MGDVLPQIAPPPHAPSSPGRLLIHRDAVGGGILHVTELAQRLRTRIAGGKAGALERLGAQIHVQRELILHIHAQALLRA